MRVPFDPRPAAPAPVIGGTASSFDSRYLERASVARSIKALLVGTNGPVRAASLPAAAVTCPDPFAPDFAVAGPPALTLSA